MMLSPLRSMLVRRIRVGTRLHHTIFGVATGPPPSAIAVIRISGPEAPHILKSLTLPRSLPRVAHLERRELRAPQSAPQSKIDNSFILDHALVVRYAAPKSYTGEDLVELHLHGGPAVITAVTSTLAQFPHTRPAVAGEFTRRAYRNNKMDLTEVEGVGDMLVAETEAQRIQAVRHLSAEASALYKGWREDILKVMAHFEAFIDFSEDEGIESDVLDQAHEKLRNLRTAISAHAAGYGSAERLRNGVRVALVGQPNVGKSTLMNFLVGRSASIVASGPGTTRDIVEIAGDVGGFPVIFYDTAGLRKGPEVDDVEREGVRRAQQAASAADLRICVQNAADEPNNICHMTCPGGTAPCVCANYHADSASRTLPILNKIDLSQVHSRSSNPHSSDVQKARIAAPIPVSCAKGTGLDLFMERLHEEISGLCDTTSLPSPVLVQARHREHLLDCIAAIDTVLNSPTDVVIAAEELRAAAEQFGHIVGRFETEAVLDVVFKNFCIGK